MTHDAVPQQPDPPARHAWLGPFHPVSIFLALGSASTAYMLYRIMGTLQTELAAHDAQSNGLVFFVDDWPLPALLLVHALAFLVKDIWVREWRTQLLWDVALWLGASLPIAIALTLAQRPLVEALMAEGMQ